jgi:hypothetical protein
MLAGPRYRSTSRPLPTNRRPRGFATYSPVGARPIPPAPIRVIRRRAR